VLFADISGFTALTETLAIELGPQRGAEELTAALDAVFGALLGELDRHGGDVIYFSGDAVTCWLDADDGRNAVGCALAMQRVMSEVGVRSTPGNRSATLGLKVAVAVGSARRFVVGDPQIQLIDVLAGALMDRLAEAEHAARQGEVVVDSEVMTRLGDALVLRGRRAGSGSGAAEIGVVAALARAVDLPPPRSQLPVLPDSVVRQWILPRVYERMRTGSGEFLAELRHGVPLFLRFGGIDFDGDPEAVAKLDELIVRAQRIVDADGGSVLQLTIGDKGAYLYAVFGSPVAHENDAARACASALQLLDLANETAATDLQIGLAGGRLRSGTYGHPERRTFCCLGDPVNLAARLMSAAPPGQALVSADVRRAAGDGFDWSQSTNLRLAGKAGEIAATRLLGVHRRSGHPVHPGTGALHRSPLIGRHAELAELQSYAREAIDGRGQLVVVTGDGGVGKSRLLVELTDWLATRGVEVHVGDAPAYGARCGYAAMQGVWSEILGIDTESSAEQILEHLQAALAAVDAQLVARAPLLGTLLVALPDNELTATFDAKLRKSSLEALVVEYLERREAEPLAIVIEDAEHLDALSWDLIEAIGRLAPRLAVLLVVARRPPDDGEAPPLQGLAHVRVLQLGELDAVAAHELIETRVRLTLSQAPEAIPHAVLDRLATLSQGNPFHLEELVNHLADQGIDPANASALDVSLPTSLHSLQLARIDNLPEARRTTLKVASVAGVRFRVAVLAGSYPPLGDEVAVRANAAALTQAAFVVTDQEADDGYVFRNATTQEVAYETLPFASRATLHHRIGSWLESSAPGGPETMLDLLAYHFARGYDDERKRDYLVRAGVAAQDRYANDAAVDYFRAALPLVEREDRSQLLRRLGKVLELTGHWADAEQTYLEAFAHYEGAGEARGQAQMRTDLAEVARKQGRFEDARAHLAHAGQSFTRIGDESGSATVLHLQGTLAAQQSHYDDARVAYQASLEIRQRLSDAPKIAALLSNLAVVAEYVGDYDQAWELNQRALAVREEVGDRWAIAVSRNNLGMIALLQERYAEARAHIEESMRLAALVGDVWIVAVGRHNNGNAYRGLGQYRESGAEFLEACSTMRKLRSAASVKPASSAIAGADLAMTSGAGTGPPSGHIRCCNAAHSPGLHRWPPPATSLSSRSA
jgi:predicted ATPase/class 3 adenylate cyclase